jgi:hypothetical protein
VYEKALPLNTHPGLVTQTLRLSVASLLKGWNDRLARQPSTFAGRKPALHERAKAIAENLRQSLVQLRTHVPMPLATWPAVNFNLYSLQDTIAELGILRSVALEQLGHHTSDAEQERVLAFFDNEIVLLCQEFSRHSKSVADGPGHSERDLGRGDTRFLAADSRLSEIEGTFELQPHHLSMAHRRRRELLRRHAELLSEASKDLASSMDLTTTIRQIAMFSIRTIADWVIIDSRDELGGFARGTVMHRDPSRKELADELWTDFGPRPDSWGVPSQVLRTRTPLLIPDVTDAHYQATRRSPRHEQILRGLGSTTYICVPMTARGEFVGAVTFVKDDPGNPYDNEDLMFAQELCSRAGMAVDNAIQFARAQNAVRLREEFVNIVSHDLKNPLTVIDMSASLMLRREAAGAPVDRRGRAIPNRPSPGERCSHRHRGGRGLPSLGGR